MYAIKKVPIISDREPFLTVKTELGYDYKDSKFTPIIAVFKTKKDAKKELSWWSREGYDMKFFRIVKVEIVEV